MWWISGALAMNPATLAGADPYLLSLLDPAEPRGMIADLRGESPVLDLYGAAVHLEGTVLVGEIEGRGLERFGAWLSIDTQGGPAPDLRLGLGRGWVRVAPIGEDGWTPEGSSLPLPGETVLKGERLSFRVDLGPTLRLEAGHAGAVVALMTDGVVEDTGPAGSLGQPASDARRILEALEAEGVDLSADPDLAVAVALDFALWYGRVLPELQPLVIADARGWYLYGLGLDRWLENRGLPWKFSTLSPMAKLLWAWAGGQSVVYGAAPLAWRKGSIDLEHYRFYVLDPQMLPELRDQLPVGKSLWETVELRDAWVWNHLRYRGPEGAMRALCTSGVFSDSDCKQWKKERREGLRLGKLGAVELLPEAAVSAGFQWDKFRRDKLFVGDCATATSVTMASYQAVGLVPLAVGYAGPDWSWPTHEQPFVLDGESFFTPQTGPSPTYALERTYTYVLLPMVHPVHSLALGTEPGGWARGGAVGGGWELYGVLTRQWENGIPLEKIGSLVEEQVSGGWPSF